ncbi:MAG: nicotinate (nicotinamide) nucleotide adenylyltransferase [Spirochaetota bacterium]
MRIAMFGGSFDPVHVGHLFVAEEARINLHYDRILFIPAFQPPHKSGPPAAPPQDRVRMLRLAVDDRTEFEVDTYELDQRGVSYTIETVRHLYETYPIEGRLGLIIGDDLLEGFHTWKESQTLEQLVEVIVATRQEDFEATHRYAAIDNSPLPVSSSDIRARVGADKAYRYLVPESVYGHIREHELYRG